MALRCCGCGRKVMWYHRVGFNPSWHAACSMAWDRGYATATEHDKKMNERFYLPSPHEMYLATQNIAGSNEWGLAVIACIQVAAKILTGVNKEEKS